MAKKKSKNSNEEEARQREEEERAEIKRRLERVAKEADEAEAEAANLEAEDQTQVDDTTESDEEAELAGQAQQEADAAHDRVQEVESDYGNHPQFDIRNIISEHGEWAVTYQGVSHLRYSIHISADVLPAFTRGYIEGRYPFTNADEFQVAYDAAMEYHRKDDE